MYELMRFSVIMDNLLSDVFQVSTMLKLKSHYKSNYALLKYDFKL